jgi:hypothetical protein
MLVEHSPEKNRRLNWRVSEFCDAFCMGRTKFYALVGAGKLKVIKCGHTTLVSAAEARRFQQAMEAGDV